MPISAAGSHGWMGPLLMAIGCAVSVAGEFPVLCRDRAAIERVYHGHRLNVQRSFEQTVPAGVIARQVVLEQLKERVLRERYGVTVSPEMARAEVRRIDATTRAPEILAEIKEALGNDPDRFARSMARPILVERELRRRFDNDDELHASRRKEAEQARERLLAGMRVEGMHETAWELTPRPEGDPAAATTPPPQTSGKAGSSLYSLEATAQVAQRLSPPPGDNDRKFYFEDLDPQLRRVLGAQLRQAGDVSAVIEIPNGFLVFTAKEIAPERLTAASLAIPKQSYETWLEQQENAP